MRSWVQGFEGYEADLYAWGPIYSEFGSPGGQTILRFQHEPLSVGGSKSGWLSVDNGDLHVQDANFQTIDLDTFLVRLEPGSSYRIDLDILRHVDFDPEPLDNLFPDVVIYEAQKAADVPGFQQGSFVVAEEVNFDRDSGVFEHLTFDFEATSNRAIVALRGPAFDAYSVEYSFSLSEVGGEEPPEPPELPQLPALVAPGAGTPEASIYTGGRVSPRNAADDPFRILYYFSPNGEEFGGNTSLGWNGYERGQVRLALKQWADVTNLTFEETSARAEANFVLTSEASLPGAAGIATFPTNNGSIQQIRFSRDAETSWSRTANAGLEKGGYAFNTLVHEFGHALGLAHPHDTGEGSEIMAGVTGTFPTFTRGEFGLNDSAHSVMSYNHHFADFYPRPELTNGYAGTPMPLDIAVAQRLYGPKPTHKAGDTTYQLGDGGAGSFVAGIYDTGGTDSIDYSGQNNAVIDLREASLRQEAGGGGFLSYVEEHTGGFSIAHGTAIENASGGGGRDKITGNDLGNVLRGKGDRDTVLGRSGDDTIMGGAGKDGLSGGIGHDSLYGGADDDVLAGGIGNDMLDGGDDTRFDIVSYKTSASAVTVDLAAGTGEGEGDDTIRNIEGARGSRFGDMLAGDNQVNVLYGLRGGDDLSGRGKRDKLAGGAGQDTLTGGPGKDVLIGGKGQDTLIGGQHADRLTGGDDADIFRFAKVGHIGLRSGQRDVIVDFQPGVDEIDLSAIDANTARPGNQAFTFIGGAAYGNSAGQLRFGRNDDSTIVAGDVDGDGTSDFRLFFATSIALTAGDFSL